MPDESALAIGATAGAWNALVRRARIGRERKYAALVLSSYAAADGTQIHCGVARLAVDCEIGYSTARRYLAWLRQVGLIELVRHGNQRRGLSDEYRLIIGPDLLEHVDVPDPAQYDGLRDALRDANRSGQRSRRTRHQRSPSVSADCGQLDEASALATVSAEPADQRSPETPSALTQGEPPPPLYTSPEELTSPNPGEDLRSKAEGPRAREDPDPISPPSLRVIEGSPTRPDPPAEPVRPLWPAAVPDPALTPDAPRGHGFCLPCYTAGKYTVAADPVNGAKCPLHLRSA